MKKYTHFYLLLFVIAASAISSCQNKTTSQSERSPEAVIGDSITQAVGTVDIVGEMKEWHKLTLSVGGPSAMEADTNPNPFLDYDFSISFKNGADSIVVPGFFAADGNAANTGANRGNVWQVRFRPNKTGAWNYKVKFYAGDKAALGGVATAVAGINGLTGGFTVEESDKTGRDLRSKGRLQYVGERYLKFEGTGEYFLKAGADAPENLLAYDDFDNTTNVGEFRKSWAPHVKDWKEGDPTWRDGKGKGLIGAVNYLASTGCNVFSFLTYNVGGDDKNVFMHTDTTKAARLHFDCSKLDQWELVFDHGDKMGMYLHFKTQEEENDNGYFGLDSGEVGVERKLYYNQLIARYGHHLALNWNLGEETTQTVEQQKAMANYFHENDPYKNHIVLHTFPYQQIKHYPPLLGDKSNLTGVSIQTEWSNVHDETYLWVKESTQAGKPWVVANDEQGKHQFGVPIDPGYPGAKLEVNSIHDIRKQVLWGNLMAGGAGVEYYFGYKFEHSDLTCQDWRTRDQSWKYASTALEFFRTHIPFTKLKPNDELVNPGSWCLAKEGEFYLVYYPVGKSTDLDLSKFNGKFKIKWFDPVAGGELQDGETKLITAGSKANIGMPPSKIMQDWAAIITPSESDEWPPVVNFDIGLNEGNDRYTVLLDASASNDKKDNGSIVSYTWDFGDGNTQTTTNSKVSYTYNSNGTSDISLKVTDSDGQVTTKTKRVVIHENTKGQQQISVEKEGIVVVEMESIPLSAHWEQSNDVAGATGTCAIQWTGNTYFDDISNGQMTYYVQINTPGVYAFNWRVAIARGDSRSEHNDTWLKIDGVKHYYGINAEGHKVKPHPFCEEGTEFECPNKEEGLEGYMKIYGGAVKDYVWVANTSDGRRHNIEIEVEEPGIIGLHIAGRSSYQAIDRFVLYKKDTVSEEKACDIANAPSEIIYKKL